MKFDPSKHLLWIQAALLVLQAILLISLWLHIFHLI
jgi:hypothetical protein